MLDVSGTKRVIRQYGKLGLTKHANILSALEKRALRFSIKGQRIKDKDDILYDEALDETGTVDISELTESSADSLGEEYQNN